MKIAFTFFLSLFLTCSIGQTTSLIITPEQNINWFNEVDGQSLDSQILFIKNRILSDTNIFVRQFYNDKLKIRDSLGDRVYGNGKPLIIIEGNLLVIDNGTPNEKILRFANLINKEYIKKIGIISPMNPSSISLYGTPGRNGVIEIYLRRKKYLKVFKNLNFSSSKYSYL